MHTVVAHQMNCMGGLRPHWDRGFIILVLSCAQLRLPPSCYESRINSHGSCKQPKASSSILTQENLMGVVGVVGVFMVLYGMVWQRTCSSTAVASARLLTAPSRCRLTTLSLHRRIAILRVPVRIHMHHGQARRESPLP